METVTTMWQNMWNMFKPNKDKLRKEATERANEKFNIIREDGISYIVFGNVKVTTKSQGSSDDILKTLYELREMYIEQYVENEGRI